MIVEAAKKLVPLVREHVERGERERRLPDPVARALREAGMFRLCRPKELGGLELDPLTSLAVIEELAAADGAAGWCAMINGAGGAFEAFVPASGARAIFTGPEVVVGGVFAPTGRAVAEGDGFRVSGRWAVASNVHHSDWLGGSCIVFEGDQPKMTPMGPAWIVPLMPASACRVLDTWSTSGLRGTGSHDFEVEDLLVPADRCIRVPMTEATFQGALFRFPFFAFLSTQIAAVALGIARAALEEIVRVARTKTPFGMMSPLATRASAQIAISEAEAELAAGRALLQQRTREIWDAVSANQPVSPAQRADLRRASAWATACAARAVDRVYHAGGASALYEKSPLQRCFRDVHAITQHVFVAPHGHELFGQIHLGVVPDAPML